MNREEVGRDIVNYCSCGCGTVIADDKRFVRGHAARMESHPFHGGFMKGKKFSPSHIEALRKARIGRFGRPGTYLSTTIDWDWLVDGYNKKYGTDFKNEKDLYLHVYPELSPRKIAKILGVCATTIRRRLDIYGIERNHKRGGANNTKSPKRDAFLAIPASVMATMTLKEITRKVGADRTYCWNLACKYGRTYKGKWSKKKKQ